MIIENSTSSDLETILKLYDSATAHQKEKQAPVAWPLFSSQMVKTEIAEQRQWKLIMDGQVACVWVITFSDPEIWEQRNTDAAVYIHRIATNPLFRGQNLLAHIVDWAKTFAATHQKTYVRLDTVGNNTKLIDLYTKAGFTFLGLVYLQSTKNLPPHYQQGDPICLFELVV